MTDSIKAPPSCSLDESGLSSQRERYRQVALGARAVERSSRRLVVDLGQGVDFRVVDDLIGVERECCPFLQMDWDPISRRLSVWVERTEHEAALDAIAYAFGVTGEGSSRRNVDLVRSIYADWDRDHAFADLGLTPEGSTSPPIGADR